MLKRLYLLCLILLSAATALAGDFTVSDIQISGNSRVAESTIFNVIHISPGDSVSVGDIDQAVHDVYALGSFKDVGAEVVEVNGLETLVFSVEELPVIRNVEYAGIKDVKRDKLAPLLKVRIPSIYNKAKIDESISEFRNVYIEDGYHAVKITTELRTDVNNEATLIFHVDEGDKVLIRDITFVGTTVFKKKELLKKMETKEKWFLSWLTGRGAYLKDAMELDVERIKMAYQDVGYQDVKVKPADVTLVDDKYLQVVIEVEEGLQYHVGDITISGDMMKTEDELKELLKLKSGDVFSRSELRNSIVRLTDLYADSGYAYANVTPLTNKNSEKLLVGFELNIEQGRQYHVTEIRIHGNTKTRDKVIRREISLLEGELYNATKVKAANRRIRNLGFFEEVNLTNKPGSEPDSLVLDVDVSEQPTGTFSVGAGYSSADGPVFQGSVSQDNFMGYGVNVSIGGTFGGSSTTYTLSVSDPHFLDTDWFLGGEIYKSEYEYSDYDDYRTGGAIKGGHPLSENVKFYLTYRFEQKEISDVDDDASATVKDAEGESTLSSLTADLVRNSTDNYQDPSKGGITKLSLEFAGLGGTENFLKGIADHRHFFPVIGDTVFSVHGSIGYIMKTWTDDDIPMSEKFFLGGIRTLRGFESREVGPMEDGDYIGGEKMAYANFEYIFPIAKDMGFKGVLFYDIGNAWGEDEDYFSDLRHSAGAGIRWLSPLGPLRFEWGYNLDPRDGEKRSVFEFTIGKAF